MNEYKVMNLMEVEQEFGIGVSMLKKLILNKEISCVKIGAKNHIRIVDVMAYIEDRTVAKH